MRSVVLRKETNPTPSSRTSTATSPTPIFFSSEMFMLNPFTRRIEIQRGSDVQSSTCFLERTELGRVAAAPLGRCCLPASPVLYCEPHTHYRRRKKCSGLSRYLHSS